jgi:hypothetical protein
MKDPECLKKVQETVLAKTGYKYAFAQPWVYDKIRKIHKDNLGVEYPFQCKDVIEKCKATFRALWGADFPLLSRKYKAYFNKIMLEKHGGKWSAQCPEIQIV